MISREELEKMIENSETVWYLESVGNSAKKRIASRKLVENKYVEFMITDKNTLYEINPKVAFGVWEIKIDRLYKTKEDAEWKIKTTAVREERFEPPTWEEFIGTEEYDCSTPNERLSIEMNKHSIPIAPDYDKEETIDFIEIYSKTRDTFYFQARATKENYEKAVALARKLFLGENIDA